MTRFLMAVSALAIAATPVLAKDQIRVVGSGTVYPFTATVAEAFGKATGKKTPVVEANGSGPGIKLFCAGSGDDTPDFVDASRRMKAEELATCNSNGNTVTELVIGYDGIALANAKGGPVMSITKQQLFLALAKQVPGKDGKLIDNPYKQWADIDPSLPKVNIVVLSHPATSGTRDTIAELIMDAGASSIESLKALKAADAKAFEAVWKTMRNDGGFVEAGENDNAIVQKLAADPNTYALFGYANVALNGAKIQASKVEGEAPTMETVANGKYKVSRPLYIYAKDNHAATTPDMAGFLAEYFSKKALGDDGYLADKGLIALPKEQFEKEAAKAKALTPLTAADFK